MFTSIFQSLASGLGDLLDVLVTSFMGALDINLSTYLVMFPFLETLYSILQSMAFALIAVVAGKSLAMFWLGAVDTSSMQDRPVNILLRAFISAMAVYFGGYILAFITSWATIPFEQFRTAAVTESNGMGLADSILVGAAGLAEAGIAPTVAVGDLAISMLELLLLMLIAVNLFKLAVEVCERYMMVGLLVFTAPIIYPTITTKESSQVFKKWCSMFVGSLIMMSVSVIFLKLIVNGLNHIQEGNSGGTSSFFVRMLIILATCKIAQRTDTYLRQLGLNVATTGGNMLDDMMALARSLGRATGGSKGGILGNGDRSIAARTPLGRGARKAISDYAAGKSARESFRAGARVTAESYKTNTAVGRASSAVKNARTDGKTGSAQVVEGAKGFASGTAKSAANIVAPRVTGSHDGIKTGAQEKQLAEQMEKDAKREAAARASANSQASRERDRETRVGFDDLSPEMQSRVEQGKKINDRDAQINLESSGVVDRDGRAFITDVQSGDDSAPGIPEQARAAGLILQSDDDGRDYVSGPARAAGEFLARAAVQAADIPCEVGAFARNDESLPNDLLRKEASSVARGEYATAKNAVIRTSIEKASPAALERMLTGTTAMTGTRDMAESIPSVSTEKAAGESEADYRERYTQEMQRADSFYTKKNDEGGFNPYAIPIAEKVFCEMIPSDAKLVRYEADDGGVRLDQYGHAVDHGRTHVLTYEDSAGKTSKLELLDKVAYSALSEKERTSTPYGTFTSAIDTVFYVKGSSKNISAKAIQQTERRPANIVTNIGKGSRGQNKF